MDAASILYPTDPFAPKAPETTLPSPPAPIASEPVPDSGETNNASQESLEAKESPSAAEIMYGTDAKNQAYAKLGNIDGMAPGSPDQYSIVPEGHRIDEGGETEAQQMREAFHGIALSQDMVSGFVDDYVRYSEAPVQATEADLTTELSRIYGNKWPEKIELAQKLITRTEAKWPNIRQHLNASGMGRDITTVLKVIAKAESLQKKGHL